MFEHQDWRSWTHPTPLHCWTKTSANEHRPTLWRWTLLRNEEVSLEILPCSNECSCLRTYSWIRSDADSATPDTAHIEVSDALRTARLRPMQEDEVSRHWPVWLQVRLLTLCHSDFCSVPVAHTTLLFVPELDGKFASENNDFLLWGWKINFLSGTEQTDFF